MTKEPKKDRKDELSEQLKASSPNMGYVVVLTRSIPIDEPSTDIVTHICMTKETIDDIWKWAESKSKNCGIIKIEITKST